MNDHRILFTVGQLAERLGFGKAKIKQLIDAGELEAVNTAPSGSPHPEIRVTKRSVNRWLKRCLMETSGEPQVRRKRPRGRNINHVEKRYV